MASCKRPSILKATSVINDDGRLIKDRLNNAVGVSKNAYLINEGNRRVLCANNGDDLCRVLHAICVNFSTLFKVMFDNVRLLSNNYVSGRIRSFTDPHRTFRIASVASGRARLQVLVAKVFLFRLGLLRLVTKMGGSFLCLQVVARGNFRGLLSRKAHSSNGRCKFVIGRCGRGFCSSVCSRK